MKYVKINPKQYPIQQGEYWWIVPHNQKDCEFKIPVGAAAVLDMSAAVNLPRPPLFDRGVAYEITQVDYSIGWITVQKSDTMVHMPFYIFARLFDAEAFIRGIPTAKEQEQMATAQPFDYKPTLPMEEHNG